MTPARYTRSSELELIKLHGLGNDFLVVLGGETADLPGGPGPAKALCDRHTGVGADGLIVGGRLDGGRDTSADAVISFRLWNADGSEAEMSGNGVRCLAHAALDAGWVPEGVPFGVATGVGRKEVVIRRQPEPDT
ncbi:MAG: hypothetical protein JO337_09900, partial [Acidimicrobiales bacterium]|nr:hypothetical protein [Acidimicrobiales bacterium]